MAVSPWKTYARFKKAVWSGRSRRLAKIIDADRAERAQDNNQPAPTHKTPGSRSE